MKKLEYMTLQEKIGQLMLFGFMEDDIDGMLELIEKYKVGNIILFTRNGKDAKTLFHVNQKIQKHALEKLGIPLYISTDQEGGMVTRVLKNATYFPGNMTLGATNNPENAYIIGKAMGKELLSLGINMDLAPVLDVNNNINNPVIGVRSYGDNPELVAEYGINFIKGLQESNVLATGKHFPGHGDTNVDSHLDLPTINHDKKRLNEVELLPFKRAIAANIQAIMSAHVLFPAYEPEKLPATLSKKVLTDLLRKELGFNGLIITDCMEMKAIDTYYTTEKATVDAIKAGANLVIISHTRNRQIKAIEEVTKAVLEKRLDEKIIDEAVLKVLQSKEKIVEDAIAFTKKTYADIENAVNVKEHREQAERVVNDALTLVNGEVFKDQGKVLFIAPNPKATTIADDEVAQKGLLNVVRRSFPHWEIRELEINPSIENQTEILKGIDEFDQVVFCSYNANIYKKQRELIEEVSKKCENMHVIALRNPYDVIGLKANCVCIYEYTPLSVETIIKYLQGTIKPNGKLPVKLDG